MTIAFADGTRIEVDPNALDDFLRHDLKWVEFVHGRAAEDEVLRSRRSPVVKPVKNFAYLCPSNRC